MVKKKEYLNNKIYNIFIQHLEYPTEYGGTYIEINGEEIKIDGLSKPVKKIIENRDGKIFAITIKHIIQILVNNNKAEARIIASVDSDIEYINDIKILNNMLLVGGTFTSINSKPASGLAIIDENGNILNNFGDQMDPQIEEIIDINRDYNKDTIIGLKGPIEYVGQTLIWADEKYKNNVIIYIDLNGNLRRVVIK